DGEADIAVIAEASDLSTVVSHVIRHLPDVLILDPHLPDGSSIETIRQLGEQVPGTEIIVLTMEESPFFAQQALDAGAIGLVPKDRADTDLPAAIRRATSGEEYVSARIAAGVDALR